MPKNAAATETVATETPRLVEIGVTPLEICAALKIVDAETGETIDRVVRADADAGTIRRFTVVDGNLVRKDDSFEIIDEERAIRIEWIAAPDVDADDNEGQG